MDNRNEPTDMDLIDSPRRTPTPPPLSACEQILQTKAQLQKMETFKSSSWPASLNFKPCPITTRMSLSTDVPFRSFKKNEETINLAVVLKGLPRNFKVEEIQADLEELGFTPEKVNQLIGRRSKQPIPVFLVTLPRSIENLKIFHLKTLSYLSIRVEGYNGKGVTQCYTCNHFHHNSENCHLNPRCLNVVRDILRVNAQ
ncbi:nucleic-acid-binding protein from transposon X-element [Trichonephila clavipes]|nr:nucleic-acid-binding protein from transposon X-element [Trichonephila clavipes]